MVEDRGVQQLRDLSRRLREAGDRGLKREFTREITKALKPLRQTALPASAMATLPRRGGLNRVVAKSKYRVQRKTGARSAGIRLIARNQYDLFRIDAGIVRHPVFKRRGEGGRRAVWVTQRVPSGWFTRPTQEAAPQVRAGITAAMEHIARQIDGRERSTGDSPEL